MKQMEATFLERFTWATFGRIEAKEEFQKKYSEQKDRLPLLPSHPLFSIVIADTGRNQLRDTLLSLIAQSYPHWEAIIVSSKPIDLPLEDRRIRVVTQKFELPQVNGLWTGFVDEGDILNPAALFLILTEIQKSNDAMLVYSNEAKLAPGQTKAFDFWSKGEFHWFNLIHFNSVGRFWAAKTSALIEYGKFHLEFVAEEELSFFQWFSLTSMKALQLPLYLYYRVNPPQEDLQIRRLATEQHLKQRGFNAFVGMGHGHLDVQPVIQEPDSHLVSCVIPFKDKPEWTLKALEALSRQRGQVQLEVFLVSNGSTEASWEKVANGIKRYPFPVQLTDYPGAFNFGALHNSIITNKAKGNLILLLNNDVFLSEERNLDLLAGWALQSWVGTVGVRLHYEYGRIQHSGMNARFGGNARMVRVGNGQAGAPFSHLNHTVFGNTFACAMFKRETFEQLGGFRTIDLANGFGDIAFNLECKKRGLQNIYLGSVSGTHLESATRGSNYEYWEECILEKEYPELLQKMLREDAGMNPFACIDSSAWKELKDLFVEELRKRAPWLKSVKRLLEARVRPLIKAKHV